MDWFIAALIGIAISMLLSPLANMTRMPASLRLSLGVGAALLGGTLERFAAKGTLGPWGFYAASTALAIGIIGGGVLAYGLTRVDRRI